MSFYDEVLRELLAAVGGALFVGNLIALLRRRSPDGSARTDLPRAPVARTAVYLVLGFVVMVWGIGSLVAG